MKLIAQYDDGLEKSIEFDYFDKDDIEDALNWLVSGDEKDNIHEEFKGILKSFDEELDTLVGNWDYYKEFLDDSVEADKVFEDMLKKYDKFFDAIMK